jgi:hypothetical protein
MSNTTTTQNLYISTLEDWLPYLVPIFVAFAGFNWATLIPGNNNPVLVAAAFGFLAKFLYGLQQTLSSNPAPTNTTLWEDIAGSIGVGLGVITTVLTADPDYLIAGTVIGFVAKALGYFQTGNLAEDLLLAVGAFLIAYGGWTGNAEIVSAGSLIAVVGKTAPSLGAALAPMNAPASAAPVVASTAAGH